MHRTIEAVIRANGQVELQEPVSLSEARRALVTILDEAPGTDVPEHPGDVHPALLAEPALAAGWDRPEEDEAWRHLADLPDLDAPDARK